MKKKLTVFLATICAAGSCLGLVGCKPSKEEVFEKCFRAIHAQNSTVTVELINTYAREEAENYGQWESYKINIKTDAVANFREVTMYQEYWTESTGGAKATFTVENYTAYYFEYQQKYYWAMNDYSKTGNPWTVESMEKAEFLETVNSSFLSEVDFDYEIIGALSSMKSLFEWNKDLRRYDLTLGACTSSIKILENKKGIEFEEEDLLTKGTVSITEIGTTTIILPNDVTEATNKYISAI